MPEDENGSWGEYKKLVLKELERNDENFDKILKAVQGNSEKLSGITEKLQSVDTSIRKGAACERGEKIEKRVLELEKGFASLKMRVIILSGAVGAAASGALALLFHFAKQ